MLFAIDAGDQVVAVDDQSNYPEEAPRTDLSGFEPNVEAIVAEDPDLVVLSEDTGDVVAGLEAADVGALLLPAATTLDDSYDQIEKLGDVTGHADEAADVVQGMQDDIEEITSSLPEREGEAPTYYHELDQTLYTATSSTFIGQVYDLVGLENIADAADDGSGYPQLSAEHIIDQDPDLIFLADTKCCGQTAETVAARPGWAEVTAVRQDHVVELDDDIASRWGPRVVDLLRTVADEVARVPA
jgi:iron complex transport system substrate-binding protein